MNIHVVRHYGVLFQQFDKIPPYPYIVGAGADLHYFINGVERAFNISKWVLIFTKLQNLKFILKIQKSSNYETIFRVLRFNNATLYSGH